ncbi:hypothetical protein N665_0413s0007 [Sinapis alba]|nr:hypothetical protein N665_0413s0007 [Sinapis alba]
MPSDTDGTRSRIGGMTVSLASPDGRVVGGGVVVGSFIAGTNQQDQNPRKQHNHNFVSSQVPTFSYAADHRTIHPTPPSL